MLADNALTLLINGLTLALSISFLIILLWYDPRREVTQYYAVFLAMVLLWNLGSLLTRVAALVDPAAAGPAFALFVLELGFTGSSIALYALVASLVKLYSRRFRLLVLLAIVLLLAYRLVLFSAGAPAPFVVDDDGQLLLQTRGSLLVFYLLFDGAALYLLLRYRRKIRLNLLKAGLFAFIIGQSLGFLNPELQSFALSTIISALAALLISVGILQQEIFRPLAERNTEVEAIRKVIASTASQSAVETILAQVTRQAAELIEGDGAAVFLLEEGKLVLRTTYELEQPAGGRMLTLEQGMAGAAAQKSQLIQVDDYARQWKGPPDFDYGPSYFGAALCAPLVAGGGPIGALLVVASPHGRLFDREDGYLLQLLAAQLAVAITQNRLLSEQTQLTEQVEQGRTQLETVLASTESPVIAVDRDFRLIFANPAAQFLFDEKEAARGRSVAELLPASAFPPNMRAALREIRRRRSLTYEAAMDDRIYLCHVAGLGGTRSEGWVAVLNDITQLKELDRLKSEMVRMTSHDLKNPLQAAMANLDLLREDVYDSGDEEVRQSIDTIDRQLARMNRIIRGILDLERVRDGAMVLEMCSPARIIGSATQEMREYAREHQVELDTSAPDDMPEIAVDMEQFSRALVNLIENAIKFTPAGGHVAVSASQADSEVVFSVVDNGVGISPEQQERVFDRFYRGKQKGVEHVSGSGLGLSLVKAIVTHHHGRVWLESEEGIGTRFYVAVPVAAR